MECLLLPPSGAPGRPGVASDASKMSPRRHKHGLLAPQDALKMAPQSPPGASLSLPGAVRTLAKPSLASPDPLQSLPELPQSFPRVSQSLPGASTEPPKCEVLTSFQAMIRFTHKHLYCCFTPPGQHPGFGWAALGKLNGGFAAWYALEPPRSPVPACLPAADDLMGTPCQ